MTPVVPVLYDDTIVDLVTEPKYERFSTVEVTRVIEGGEVMNQVTSLPPTYPVTFRDERRQDEIEDWSKVFVAHDRNGRCLRLLKTPL